MRNTAKTCFSNPTLTTKLDTGNVARETTMYKQ